MRPNLADEAVPAEMRKLKNPLASINKSDMNKAPRNGRLIRPSLAGSEVTGG
jgi:hypothetical protein